MSAVRIIASWRERSTPTLVKLGRLNSEPAMYPHVAHVFVDGDYLRELGREYGADFPNPRSLAKKVVESPAVQSWASDSTRGFNALLGRVTFYDALPGDAS